MKTINFAVSAALLCACLLLLAAPARADIAVPLVFTKSSLDSVLNSSLMTGSGILKPAAIKAFYAARDNEPVWQGTFRLHDQIDPFVTQLEDSWMHGLNPRNYHVADIKRLEAEKNSDSKAQLEILLTDAFVRYVRDMSGMRINPNALGLDPADWKKPYTPEQALGILKDATDIPDLIMNLAPRSRTYRALQAELIKLASKPVPAYEAVLPIDLSGRTVKPMMRDQKIPDLRLRLGVGVETENSYLYDDRLAAAVMAFQRDSGLPSDGVIGGTTLKLLNRSDAGRMRQIVANLERLRWVNEQKPSRFVMVNIPAATLWAIDDNKVAFEMPVIVGKLDLQTQMFIATVKGVRFNPGWTVPFSIMKKDILPKLQANPKYLNDKGIELVRMNGGGDQQTIDPSSVDWNSISSGELGHYEMTQIPGPHNPLGRIRILMPNRFDEYLHDTNEPGYFGKQQRAQSHGCIRMSRPEDMARFVMAKENGWTEQKMQTYLDAGTTHDERIAETFPVYVVYYTAWISDQGKVVYGNDIYGLDDTLVGLLTQINGFSIPGHDPGAALNTPQPSNSAG